MEVLRKISLLVLGSLFALSLQAAEVSPMTIEGAKTVTTDEAKSLFDNGALFVDVRRNSDWENGRIPDAVHLELKSNFTEASLSAEAKVVDNIVIYCNGENCLRSSKASKQAVGWGYSNVYYYRDGFPAWKASNLPVE